jgi:hypothetical protein
MHIECASSLEISWSWSIVLPAGRGAETTWQQLPLRYNAHGAASFSDLSQAGTYRCVPADRGRQPIVGAPARSGRYLLSVRPAAESCVQPTSGKVEENGRLQRIDELSRKLRSLHAMTGYLLLDLDALSVVAPVLDSYRYQFFISSCFTLRVHSEFTLSRQVTLEGYSRAWQIENAALPPSSLRTPSCP